MHTPCLHHHRPDHHTGWRHPSVCRFCKEDHRLDPDERKLAPSERAKRGQIGLGLEQVSATPMPRSRVEGQWRRVLEAAKSGGK